MKLFDRFEELNAVLEGMNAEATGNQEIPYVRFHEFVLYRDVKTFFTNYTRRLRLPPQEAQEMLAFCYRDMLWMKTRIGDMDVYALTYYFFRDMCYRTGNLDTADDCVEKIDMDLFLPYKAAREKQWRGEALSQAEEQLLQTTFERITARLRPVHN